MIRNAQKFLAASFAALALGTISATASADGSDYAFDRMVGGMAGRDTGSAWFDGYVETVNQQIAYLSRAEPYGAAGPNGPVDGFNGYVAGFVAPDTGSMLFNDYVDAINRVIRSKQER